MLSLRSQDQVPRAERFSYTALVLPKKVSLWPRSLRLSVAGTVLVRLSKTQVVLDAASESIISTIHVASLDCILVQTAGLAFRPPVLADMNSSKPIGPLLSLKLRGF
jgi:hypothetical protein